MNSGLPCTQDLSRRAVSAPAHRHAEQLHSLAHQIFLEHLSSPGKQPRTHQGPSGAAAPAERSVIGPLESLRGVQSSRAHTPHGFGCVLIAVIRRGLPDGGGGQADRRRRTELGGNLAGWGFSEGGKATQPPCSPPSPLRCPDTGHRGQRRAGPRPGFRLPLLSPVPRTPSRVPSCDSCPYPPWGQLGLTSQHPLARRPFSHV